MNGAKFLTSVPTKFQVQHEAAHQDSPAGADDREGEGRVLAQVGQNSGGRHRVRRQLSRLGFDSRNPS